MATGVPMANGNGAKADPDYWIEYEHKPARGKIPVGPPANLRTLFSTGSQPTNRLIYADNLQALRSLLEESPSIAQLIYIDPPYATQSRFVSPDDTTAYEDYLGGASYLEFMRERLVLLRELLSDDGSIYVHLDANMVFPVKILLDESFGQSQFRSMITRVKCNPKNFTSRQFGDVCDYLLFYSKTKNYFWQQPYIAWDEESARAQYQYVEDGTGRRYKKVPVHAPGTRNGSTGGPWKGRMPPPGKHWVLTPDRLDALDSEGRIYWSETGNPRRKIYLDESPGIRVGNMWTDYRDSQNQNARMTGYPTEKNLRMMELILQASSEPGRLVLDAFAGSGSTLAAADAHGRPWIGIDSSPEAIRTSVRRLVHGTPRLGSYARNTHLHDAADTGYSARKPFEVLVDADFEGEPLAKSEFSEWLEVAAESA